jgi:hypothetical protein
MAGLRQINAALHLSGSSKVAEPQPLQQSVGMVQRGAEER